MGLVPNFLQSIGLALANATVIESIFSIPGFGYLIVNHVLDRDTPMIHAEVFFWRWRCWRECTCTAGVTGIPRKMRKREFVFRPIAGNALWEGTRLSGRLPYSGLPS